MDIELGLHFETDGICHYPFQMLMYKLCLMYVRSSVNHHYDVMHAKISHLRMVLL